MREVFIRRHRLRDIMIACTATLLPASAPLAEAELLFRPAFREASIQVIIDAVGEITGRELLLDPRISRLIIDFESEQPMRREEIWDAFLEGIAEVGLVAIETQTGSWRISPETQ